MNVTTINRISNHDLHEDNNALETSDVLSLVMPDISSSKHGSSSSTSTENGPNLQNGSLQSHKFHTTTTDIYGQDHSNGQLQQEIDLQPMPTSNMSHRIDKDMIIELDSTSDKINTEEQITNVDESASLLNAHHISIDSDLPSSDPEDDFISSDDESLHDVLSGAQFNAIGSGSTFHEHVLYFEKVLDTALDLRELDKSLVAQAKLSGQLNDTNQMLLEKQIELRESLKNLRELYSRHITSKRIDTLEADIRDINSRIRTLKHGPQKALFFGQSKLGLMDKYPVEFNQARDKVLERPEE